MGSRDSSSGKHEQGAGSDTVAGSGAGSLMRNLDVPSGGFPCCARVACLLVKNGLKGDEGWNQESHLESLQLRKDGGGLDEGCVGKERTDWGKFWEVESVGRCF